MIEVKDLTFRYPESDSFCVLRGISFSMDAGEKVALMGANGSGKTTFVRCLNGLLQPSSGEVCVDGFSISDEKSVFEVRRRVGMVFQNPDNQIVSTTVEREIIFGLENLGLPRPEMEKRLNEALERFHLQSYRMVPPHMLSGGERQRLALASVWVMHPRYLVLDEPTSLLHPQGRQEVLQYLNEEMGREKIGVLMVTQSPEEAMECDRLILMEDGKIARDDLPERVFLGLNASSEKQIAVPVEFELKDFIKRIGLGHGRSD
jgi:energy-coupling factor transport system ATP-binding protein